VVVAAADHGVAAQGVSAYPSEVTAQMLANFHAGGAAVCVLARLAGADLRVFDVGVGAGTDDMTTGPAMSAKRARRCLGEGRAVAAELAAEGFGIVAVGEMGIGNTTSASAIAAALLGADPAAVCGRGTGLDDEGVRHKAEVVARALDGKDLSGGEAVLGAVGGFEIGFLAGVILGAVEHRLVIVLDGFITGAAALVATAIDPSARDVLVAAHRSPEPGHALVLEALGLEPLLDLQLRLGEASGAALALPLVDASLVAARRDGDLRVGRRHRCRCVASRAVSFLTRCRSAGVVTLGPDDVARGAVLLPVRRRRDRRACGLTAQGLHLPALVAAGSAWPSLC
jgi:nicotinate-nucleotide--dimethylbenzimidazole phosphoribosyltransferase